MSDAAYGQSEFGARLDFDNRKCRDPFCAIIYYLHLAGVIAAVVYIFDTYWDEIDNVVDNATDNLQDVAQSSFDFTGIYVRAISISIHLHAVKSHYFRWRSRCARSAVSSSASSGCSSWYVPIQITYFAFANRRKPIK